VNVFSRIRQSLREPGDLWRRANRSSRVMLLAGAFFLFAIVGLLADAPTAVLRGSWGHAVLIAVFSGAISTAYVWSLAAEPRWFPVVVGVQIVLTALIARFEPSGPAAAGGPLGLLLEHRLLILSSLVIACVSISWTLLLSFVTRGGRRYVTLATELSLARTIHQTLVPRIERQIDGFEFYAVSMPSGEVGGDLVDVVEHGAGHGWTAYLVDVSGHGVPSGVLMGMVKSAVRMALTTPGPLDAMLANLNDVVYELSQPQMFATFGAIRPVGAGRLAYTQAGHLPILAWRKGTGAIETLHVAQVPVGMLPGREYTAAETTAGPGDLFLILTDGLTECFDRHDREFGLDGVRQTLAAQATAPLAEAAAALLAASRAHGQQLDDQSLILIRCARA
jgi:hypothetical protein